VIIDVLTLLHKTGFHLEASCSFPDANLESGKELYVYCKLIVGSLVSETPILGHMAGILNANGWLYRKVWNVQ
jgi:hypothetical protein